MTEHRRQPGRLRRDLVVVHRVEVARRARVHHEVGARELVIDRRRGVADLHVVVPQLLFAHVAEAKRSPDTRVN